MYSTSKTEVYETIYIFGFVEDHKTRFILENMPELHRRWANFLNFGGEHIPEAHMRQGLWPHMSGLQIVICLDMKLN